MSNLLRRSLQSMQRCSSIAFYNTKQIQKHDIVRAFSDESKEAILPPKRAPKFKLQSNITWQSVTISTVLGASLLGYMYYLKQKKELAIEKDRRRQLGKAQIGGKFELMNSKGELVKSDDFLGQWICIYFGFTHCPDVCPDEIEKLVKVVNMLEDEYEMKLQPIFISVDPARDSPAIVEKYCNEFSPKLIGLTGNTEQVAAACKSYRVYYSNGPKDQDDDYIVDHTIIIYLVDPDGLFVDYYGQTVNVDQMVGSIVLNKEKFDRIKSDSVLPTFSFKKPLPNIS